MSSGLEIRVVDPDDDYLGIEIRAWGDRFAGSTRIYAGLTQLAELADAIDGFPAGIPDERTFRFGSRDPKMAGGYCLLVLRTTNSWGGAEMEVEIDDDSSRYSHAVARFTIPVFAAGIDAFVMGLRSAQGNRAGSSSLAMSD